MLAALRLGTLLVPIDNCLVGDAILVVKNFEDLGEGLDNTSILVAVQLDGVDQGYLSLCGAAERLKDGSEFLFVD